jgi:hypothetical protein
VGRKRFIACLAALTAAVLLAPGCGKNEPDDTPTACLAGSDAYLSALQAAPGEVRLEGESPISECLVPEPTSGDLSESGRQMIKAATDLNALARRDPTGPEAVQLGYLIGAVERGSDSAHADLVLRINSAARFSPEGLLPAEFERTFGEGYNAGLESG